MGEDRSLLEIDLNFEAYPSKFWKTNICFTYFDRFIEKPAIIQRERYVASEVDFSGYVLI